VQRPRSSLSGRWRLVASAVVIAASGCGGTPAPSSRAPNLVLVVIDTLRADRLPIYGHAGDTAPFLTALATRSVVFERARSTSSWTSPATVSLMTSLLPFQHGVHSAEFVPGRGAFAVQTIPDAVETLAETLRRSGYRTFAVVDNKNVLPEAGFARGFERYEHMDYEGAAAVRDVLAEWREAVRAARPYFLYVHLMDPHIPYHAREPWYSELSSASTETDPARRDALARYDSEIRHVDEHLHALWGAWEWEHDAIVVVTSDHGEEFGEHGGEQHARTLFAEVLDVPLLLHHPDRWTDGRRVEAPASLIDVAPTLLDLAGLPPSAAHAGRSLVPVVEEAPDATRAVYAQLQRSGDSPGGKTAGFEIRGVIANERKLLVYDDRPDELFDLRTDPAESRNVIAERSAEAAAMRADLERAGRRGPHHVPGRFEIPLSPKQAEKMRALGYLK